MQTQNLTATTDRNGQAGQPTQSARLHEAAQQFESLFVNLLLKSMRSTVIESDLIENKSEINTYRQLLDQEMSKQMASGPQGLGIAELIVQRFRVDQDANEPAATTHAVGGADFRPVPEATRQRAARAYGSEGATAPVTRIPPPQDGLLERARELSSAAADTVTTYGALIDGAAQRTGVAQELILAVILGESSGAADAVSSVGAQGLMQLMPATATELGVADPFDPGQNIEGGARYLAQLQRRFGDDLELVLAGYNAGPGRVARAGNSVPDIAETRGYVHKIKDLYRRLLGSDPEAGGKD